MAGRLRPLGPEDYASTCRVCGAPLPARAVGTFYRPSRPGLLYPMPGDRVRLRRAGKVVTGRLCLVCGRPFPMTRVNRRYCSDKCRHRAHNRPVVDAERVGDTYYRYCLECGRRFAVTYSHHTRHRYCSRRCKDRAVNRRWYRLHREEILARKHWRRTRAKRRAAAARDE